MNDLNGGGDSQLEDFEDGILQGGASEGESDNYAGLNESQNIASGYLSDGPTPKRLSTRKVQKSLDFAID